MSVSPEVINSDDPSLYQSSPEASLSASPKPEKPMRKTKAPSYTQELTRSPTPTRCSERRPSPSRRAKDNYEDEDLIKQATGTTRKRRQSKDVVQKPPKKPSNASQSLTSARKITPTSKPKTPLNVTLLRQSTSTLDCKRNTSQTARPRKPTGNSQSTTHSAQVGGGLDFEEDNLDGLGHGQEVDEDEVVLPHKKQKVLPKPKVTDLLAGRKEKEKKDKERKEKEKERKEQERLAQDLLEEEEFEDMGGDNQAGRVDQELTRLENGGEADQEAQHEGCGETPDQVLARLKLVPQQGAFRGLTLEQLEERDDNPDSEARPPRGYFRQTYKQIAMNICPRIKRLEDLSRLVFFVTWDMQACMNLIPHVFPEFMNDVSSAWIPELGAKRVRQNCTQWKSRSIAGVKKYVKLYIENNTTNALLNATMFETSRAILSRAFTEADFYDAFAHTVNKIDIAKSSARARWFVKSAFVNLAAYAKFVVAIEMSKALYKEEYSHKVLLERWHSVLDLPVLKEFRPTLSAFRLYYSFMGKAHRTKVSSKKPSFDVTAAANMAVFGADLPPNIDKDNEVLQGY
ncbi:hypothetical protein EJ02DRAFT_439610 [Clathrospora elynae]|uniref:Uncharacterized protein n=1 Tax=Clathrospora elynae TaxID=706981 RepID=A0A6A5SBP1_9PLEO|nr:hypothetical protein EJ02DRAFT_439610 [Clathrospora elynae]